MVKKQTSIRLSDGGKELLEKLAVYYGISQADVIEMLVRKDARNEGLANKGSNSNDVYPAQTPSIDR